MADRNDDFYADDAPADESAEVEKIKLGEAEYTQDELNELVELGGRAKKIQEDHGDLDRFVSEFGRKSQEIGTYKKELEELRAKIEDQKADSPTGELNEFQKEAAKKQISSLLGGEPVTMASLDQWYVSRRAAEKLLEDCNSQEAKIDGSDGRPKFKTSEILQHMTETGIKVPLKAYKDKYEKELDAWKEKELAKEKGTPSFTSERRVDNKEPSQVKPNKDNLSKLVAESLYGPQE